MQKFWQHYKQFLFILTLILMLFIPLYPKIPLVGVTGSFVSVRVEDFLIAITLLFWGIFILFTRQLKSIVSDRLIQALLLFFFVAAVSLFSAIFITHTVVPKIAVLHFLRRVELMLLLPVVLTTVTTKRQLKMVFFSFVFMVVAINFYALGQQYLHFPIIATTTSELSKGEVFYMNEWTRINSTFAGHYDLATFLMMILVILSSLIFYFKNVWYNLGFTLLGAVSFFVLLLTASRFSFFGVIFGFLATLVFNRKYKFIAGLVVISIIVLLYPSPLQDRLVSTVKVALQQQKVDQFEGDNRQISRSKLNIPTLPGEKKPVGSTDSAEVQESSNSAVANDIVPGEPTDTTELGVYRSINIRTNVEWPRALRALIKNPLLGTGYSSIGLATDNDFLRSLGEVGILGTWAFGLILFVIVKRLWSHKKSPTRLVRFVSVGILAMIAAFLANAIFIDVFEASKIAALFWIINGLALQLVKLYKT
jgi:hypothetical protein